MEVKRAPCIFCVEKVCFSRNVIKVIIIKLLTKYRKDYENIS